MRQDEFGTWLKTLLEPQKFRDFCPNAICVEASPEVTKVLTGVSFRMALVDAAIARGADTLFVHHAHGFWNNEPRLATGLMAKKLAKMFAHGVSLYGFHLPLDAHPEVGNNALIAKALGAKISGSFLREGERDIAYFADFDQALSKEEFVERLAQAFPKGPRDLFLSGPDKIRRVAICSGSAVSAFPEAFARGADAFVTGESRETTPIQAEENSWNIATFGHHRTEVFGVRAMAARIQTELGLPAEFLDLDNPI